MIIGIAGRKQCGKNTISSIIQVLDIASSKILSSSEVLSLSLLNSSFFNMDYPESKWKEHSFAHILKECASIILDENIEKFESEEFKNSPSFLTDKEGHSITNRLFLQLLGTEVGRAIDPDIWVKALFNQYNDQENWIITDVRFPNEADAIKEKGGLLIKVERDTSYEDTHASEHALDQYDKFDVIIDNNGSLEDLFFKVSEFMHKYKLL